MRALETCRSYYGLQRFVSVSSISEHALIYGATQEPSIVHQAFRGFLNMKKRPLHFFLDSKNLRLPAVLKVCG